jgi:hypothetical protein
MHMRLPRLLTFLSLIWLGMILGISFVSTPLKFQAPSVTLETGLEIGRLVFGVFNKIEIAFAILIALLTLLNTQKDRFVMALGIAWLALALQSIWLLPILAMRIEIILQGRQPQASALHSIYIGLEVLKALGLAVYGFHNISPAKSQKAPQCRRREEKGSRR